MYFLSVALTLVNQMVILLFCFQSFQLQPTGTPGTFYLQTTSNQSLPLSLSNNGTVTLTTGSSPSSQEHIILHSLSVGFSLLSLSVRPRCLFFGSHLVFPAQTDGLCSGDGVIIQTVSADPAPSSEGRSQDLNVAALLEESEAVVTETPKAGSEDFTEKVKKNNFGNVNDSVLPELVRQSEESEPGSKNVKIKNIN